MIDTALHVVAPAVSFARIVTVLVPTSIGTSAQVQSVVPEHFPELPALVLQLISATPISLRAEPFTVTTAREICVLELDGVTIVKAGGALTAPGGAEGVVGVPGVTVPLPDLRTIEKLAVAKRCAESAANTTTLFEPTKSGTPGMVKLAVAPLLGTTMLPFTPPAVYQLIRQGPAPAINCPASRIVASLVSAFDVPSDRLKGLDGDDGGTGVVGVGVGVGVGGGVTLGVVGELVAGSE